MPLEALLLDGALARAQAVLNGKVRGCAVSHVV
jgi:hypothetical protein